MVVRGVAERGEQITKYAFVYCMCTHTLIDGTAIGWKHFSIWFLFFSGFHHR